MFEQIFEIEYIEEVNLAPTRIKASSMTLMYDFRFQAPRLVFLDWSYTPVFTHDGLPDIIKAIHFIKQEQKKENDNEKPTVIVNHISGNADILSQ